jgi:lipopolysaccharide transport system permease protein
VAKGGAARGARRRGRQGRRADGRRGGASSGDDRPRRRKAKRQARATSADQRQEQAAPPTQSAETEAPPAEPETAPAPDSAPVTDRHLRAVDSASGLRDYFASVWHQRAAYGYFMQSYLRKRTGRTFLGYMWLFLPYVVPILLGALVFGGILGVSIPGVPYFLYFCVTFGVWLLFSQTIYFSTRSLEITRSEIRRLYVPRLIPLTAAVTLPATGLIVFTVLLAGTTGFYVLERGEFYLALRPATLLVLPALAMLVALAWACGLWFSTLAPRARDVRRLTTYVLGFWYFLTPVMYPIDEIPSNYQFLASLNPATAPIEMVKNGLLDVGDVTSLGIASYFVGLVLVSIGGLLIFVPKERRDLAFY